MSSKKSACLSCFILISLALSFSGCSTASVGTPSGFLQDYSGLQDGTYFKQEYVPKGTSLAGYKTVKVAPVNLSHLDDQSSCNTGDLENLAKEFREDVEAQLTKSGFTVTSDPSGHTLVISLALTNIETPDRLFNVGMTAASVMSPVPLPFDKDGKTAFEGKITDGATGELLMEFAEVRSGSGDKMSLKAMTVGKYQKFTNTQAVFAGWAQTLARMLQNLTAGTTLSGGEKSSQKGKALTKQAVGMVV